MADEEGGTKIGRRPPPPQQMPPQQMPPQQQQMPPQQQYQQQMPPQQQQMPPQQQQQMPKPSMEPRGVLDKKSTFGNMANMTFDVKDFKYSVLVMVIFVLLNSKMIWTQLQKLPMMGDSISPSMLGLIVNSIIAGVSFYIIANYVIKK